MSNRSRGRHRFDQEEKPEPDPVADEMAADVDEAFKAFDTGDKKTGLEKLVGVVMKDRERALAAPDKPELQMPAPKDDDRPTFDPDAKGLREPTAYELATLQALGNRTTVVHRPDAPNGTPKALEFPVNTLSGGVYGGTVEPWRVEQRRQRNKAARAMRKRQRRLAGRR